MSKEQEYVGHDLVIPSFIWQDKNLNLVERVAYAFYLQLSKKQEELRFQPIATAKVFNVKDPKQVCTIFTSLLDKGYLAKTTNHIVRVDSTNLFFKCVKRPEDKPRPAASNEPIKGGLF